MVKKKKPEPVVEQPVAPVVNPYKEFLNGFLSGGPIVRTNVFREADNNGLDWEGVKNAFHELDGREYAQKGDIFWRIMPG